MAMIESVMYVRSKLKPSSVKRFFFFDTTDRIIEVILLSGLFFVCGLFSPLLLAT